MDRRKDQRIMTGDGQDTTGERLSRTNASGSGDNPAALGDKRVVSSSLARKL